MSWETIVKPRSGWVVTPNLVDYESERETFSWGAARRELDGMPGGGLNIAYEAVDRHALGVHGSDLAIAWLAKSGDRRELTYGDLHEQTNRFGSVLRRLGVDQGDVVFGLMGRIPELYITALGTLKRGSVFSPLFSAFGPEPIRQRVAIGKGRVLVTTSSLYARKVAAIREQL